MADKLRWGILTTGYIANLFVSDLVHDPDAEVVAVGARKQDSADAFGEKHNIPKRYGSYEEVANDPNVDVIYIGSPHPFHHRHTLMCLEAGKHLLVEKPLALNAGEAREMIDMAWAKDLFMMEAMWTRFFPAFDYLRELLANGSLGDIRMIHADFSHQEVPVDPQHRLFNPELAGGALLDIGIYPVAFAYSMAGTPDEITGAATIGDTGVDYQSSALFNYNSGAIAMLFSSMITASTVGATVSGTGGVVHIPGNWWQPSEIHVRLEGQEPFVKHFDYPGSGYQFEAMAVRQHIHAGDMESNIMPLDESLSITETMDTLRAQWGIVYPAER